MGFDFDHDSLLTEDFSGRDATYTPDGGLAKVVRVAFSLGSEEINLGGEIAPQAVVGQAGCKTADVANVKSKETLEINGVKYLILKIKQDETGWTTLYLGKGYG